MLELQCTSLRKDSQMYKKRIEAVLKQMEEVASERDQALLTREQFYVQYSKNLVERDTYRKQIRELGERCDEMQLQLFQKESQLLATEAKLKRLQLELPTPTSDLDDTSSRDSQEVSTVPCLPFTSGMVLEAKSIDKAKGRRFIHGR